MRWIILFALLFLLACGQKPKVDMNGPQTNIINPAINTEYLDWNTMKVNGQISVFCKKEELIALLGQPDSVVTPDMNDICASYFDSAFKYVYFKDSWFESAKDQMVLGSVDFENNRTITLNSGAITLDGFTTIDKLRLLFPEAVKEGTEVSVDKKGRLLCIKIATYKHESDDAWLLFFKNGKLVRMDYWMPC